MARTQMAIQNERPAGERPRTPACSLLPASQSASPVIAQILAMVMLASALPSQSLLAWTPPVNITNQATGQRAVGPCLVIDSGNTLHLAWYGGTDPSTSWRVWYQSNTGSGWTAPLSLSGADGQRPDLAVDSPGNLHLVYEETAEQNIWYRRKSAGAWSGPVNLRTGGRSIAASIAVDASGDHRWVAWHEDRQVGNEWDILVNGFRNGAWSGSLNISSDAPFSANARTAVDALGNVHVIWSGGSNDVLYRKRGSGGIWEPVLRVDHTSLRSGAGDVLVTPDNVVHVVYSEDDGGGGWEIFHRFHDGSAWSTPVNISNHSGASDDVDPRLAVDKYDRMYVVWHDYNAIYYSVKVSLGVNWTARTSIVSGAYLATAPRVAVDGNGMVHATWQSRPVQNDNWNVYYSAQSSPAAPTRGRLAGTIRDQFNQPVGGAFVSVGIAGSVSGPDGRYGFSVDQGNYGATASKVYFNPQSIANIPINPNATTTRDFVITTQPPLPVISLQVTAGNTVNVLKWTNPASGQFGGTMIRCRTDRFPTSANDGLLVLNAPAAPGSSGSHTDGNLTNGVTYHYAAFAYDSYNPPAYAAPTNATGTPAVKPDRDRDGDVDQSDFGWFQACLSGSSIPQTDPNCANAKLDNDDDVDQNDFAIFQVCFSGANVYANPNCVP